MNLRHMRERIPKSQTVFCIDGFICNTAEQTLYIINLHQRFANHVHGHIRLCQHLNRFQPLINFTLDGQRLFDKAAQRARPHRRAGVIQNPQQRSLLLSGSHGFRQFQIAARRMIEHHVSFVVILIQPRHVLQRVFLGFFEIFHQRACRTNAKLHSANAERIQALHFKMLQQRRSRTSQLKTHPVLNIHVQRRCVLRE